MKVDITIVYQIATAIVAIASLALSIIQAILRVRDKKRNITFCVINLTRSQYNGDYLIMRYRVDNLASKGISITGVKLILDNEEYPTHFISIFAEKVVYGDETLYTKLTDTIPINLGENDSHGGYLSFRVPTNKTPDPEKPLTLLISTNRGKSVKKTLSLNEDIRIR